MTPKPNNNLSNLSKLGSRAIICPMTSNLGRTSSVVTPHDGISICVKRSTM